MGMKTIYQHGSLRICVNEDAEDKLVGTQTSIPWIAFVQRADVFGQKHWVEVTRWDAVHMTDIFQRAFADRHAIEIVEALLS